MKVDYKQWWDNLHEDTQQHFLNKYYYISDLDSVSNLMINQMYEAEYRNSKLGPTITNNSDKLSFITQMKDIPLEERYDYAAAVLLTCPISVDDLSEIFNLLSGSLRKYKERNKK